MFSVNGFDVHLYGFLCSLLVIWDFVSLAGGKVQVCMTGDIVFW
jgi:hypothetical protein